MNHYEGGFEGHNVDGIQQLNQLAEYVYFILHAETLKKFNFIVIQFCDLQISKETYDLNFLSCSSCFFLVSARRCKANFFFASISAGVHFW